MKTNRGQAAFEYLSTYGWGFFVILVTIGALAYFGVFNTAVLRSGDCSFTPGAVCQDYTIRTALPPQTGGEVLMNVLNVHGARLNVSAITLVEPRYTGTMNCGLVFDVLPFVWEDHGFINITCPVPAEFYIRSEFYDFKVNIVFNQVGNTYTHNLTGFVRGSAQ
jgi:hypothetical protein